MKQSNPMKQTAIHFLTLVLIWAGHASGQAQAPVGGPPAIQVSGNAEVKVAPDLVDINFGVEVVSKDLLAAQEYMKKRVAAVIDCLKKQGIEDKDIQTDYISIKPDYGENTTKTTPNRYELNRAVRCTLRDTGKFDAVLTAAFQAGATGVDDMEFRTSELRKHRDAARLSALRAAREKAELMAKELGMKVGRALQVTEERYGDGGGWRFQNNPNGQAISRNSIDSQLGGQAEGSFAAGQIGISAAVTVSFALE